MTLMRPAGVVDVEVEPADKEVVAEGVTSVEPEEETCQLYAIIAYSV